MRAGRSRAQIQPGKAEMWNGSGDGEAGRNSCACGCSVHSAAESAKDSVRFFTISGLAARLFATVRRTEGCSVDITYKVMSIGTRDIDTVYFFRGEDGINVFFKNVLQINGQLNA